ncbi:pPIWI_RE module domain-containing protein [Promicromonospora vindobonensis]|uniref:PPIWI_RE module domain-containing protein n=1 Tax=Promicromonospora vindobonensis TaxID=195748 RepID=A0ABW5W0R4_9MICO
MPTYDLLRTTAFEVPADGLGIATHVADLPKAWLDPLRELARRASGKERASVPIRSLNGALQALVPDLGICLSYAGHNTSGDNPWLVSATPLPVERLMPVVWAWIRSLQNPNVPDYLVAEAIEAVNAAPLISRVRAVADFSDAPGTALLRILETQAATLLTIPGSSLDLDGTRLEFVRCGTSGGEAGEIMSWPPLTSKKDDAYSIVVRASAQTVPGKEQPLLYAHFGVRRWMRRTPFIVPGNATSVYLRAAVPYIENADGRDNFAIAKAEKYAEYVDGTWVRGFRWRGSLVNVLDGAGVVDKLPAVEQLMTDPEMYRSSVTAPAVVPYRPGRDSRKETVSAGVNAYDRNTLLDWVGARLGTAKLLPPLPRAAFDPQRKQVEKRNGKLKRDSVVPSLAATVGPRLTIELMTTSDTSTTLALEALRDRLPAEITLDAPVILNSDAGFVEVLVTQPAARGPVTSPLEEPVSRRSRRAAEARARDIASRLPNVGSPTITIAEIEAAATFGMGSRMLGRDPKNAIRHGLARTGRISQFVNPASEDPESAPASDAIRFTKAIDDAFRQLGVRPSPFVVQSPAGTELRPRCLALTMLRRNKSSAREQKVFLPVAVLMDVDGTNIRVLTGRDKDRAWRRLHEAIPLIGRTAGGPNPLMTEFDVESFFKEVIDDVCTEGGPVLLLTHAQKLRRYAWPHLQNPRIGIDALAFDGETRSITDYPGLRHVRVRVAEGYETPQAYGFNEDQEGAEAVGKSRGLWQFGSDRLYASTAAKPVTDQTPKGISKLPRPGEDAGMVHKTVFNPQLVELYVAAIQPGDEPVHWAALAHELRDANPYFASEHVLPWPMRIAEQLGEYISPVHVEVEDESDSGSFEQGTLF